MKQSRVENTISDLRDCIYQHDRLATEGLHASDAEERKRIGFELNESFHKMKYLLTKLEESEQNNKLLVEWLLSCGEVLRNLVSQPILSERKGK
jgi:hypothetical protein